MGLLSHFMSLLIKISSFLARLKQLFVKNSSVDFKYKIIDHGTMHTNPGSQCPKCSEFFAWCDPRIVSFTQKIQKQFLDCHVAVGFRDQADQAIAIQEGKSKDPWPSSPHNHMILEKPQSLAVDLFRLGDDGKAYFEVNYYRNIKNFYDLNPKLFLTYNIFWGGEYEHLKDFDHFAVKI